MCNCEQQTVGRLKSIYSLKEADRQKLFKKLPQLTQMRMNHVVKHIIYNFLDKQAQYIFVNGKIYTMNQKQEEAEAIAIRGQEIIFVGKALDVLPFKGQNTIIIDLNGATLLPGFIDPHVHMTFTMVQHWVDLSPFTNANMEQVQNKLINQIKTVKTQDQWILGQLLDPVITNGHFDTSLKHLDQISPKNPLFILQANGHVAYVNTVALKLAKITSQTPDPPHGRFVKDNNGQLTGQLQQSAVAYLKDYLQSSAESYLQNFKQFLRDCSKKGCTSLHDCGIGFIDTKVDLAILYQAMMQENNPPVRYTGYLVSSKWDEWMQQKMVPQNNDDYLRINGMKCWVDGSTQSGTAFLRGNYLKQQWGKGQPNYDLQKLTEAIQKANDNGWQVGVHANGDAGIDMALDAFQTVYKKNPQPQLRHRIQHCTICHEDQLKRMKQLNVSPSFLIGHVYFYGHVFKDNILGEEKANLIDPMRTSIKCGHRPSMHSDYNCQPVDPIRCLANAVTRKMKHDGSVLNAEQCITPYEALKALTIDSAWQCHIEDIVGSLEVGKKADFVILDRDPNMIPESQLINLKVLQTWMDGKRRYKHGGQFKTLKSLDSLESFRSIKSKDSLQSEGSHKQKVQSLKQIKETLVQSESFEQRDPQK